MKLFQTGMGQFKQRLISSGTLINRLFTGAQNTTHYSDILSSNYFNAAWYRLAYQNEIEFADDLLMDYLRAGIPNGRDPSPYFNSILYRRENNVPPERALLHFLRSKKRIACGAYRDEQAFLEAQRLFQVQAETVISSDRRLATKPYAVYLQCGKDSTWGDWHPSTDQPWHLLINYYDSSYAGKIPCDVELRQVGKNPGTKLTSFYTLLEKYPHILEPYDYILLLDDDVLIEGNEISRLFSIVKQQNWDMAQASLSSDSFCSFPVFYNPGKKGWRLVNGVEIMMPVYSTRILSLVKELLPQSISGWGFDAALSIKATKQGFRAAVVDDIIARHPKQTNADIGKFYQMLHHHQIYPEIEYTHLQKQYGFTKPLFYEI